MPTVDDDFLILVCDCGKRLKAPGATPGRVGRCPSCGGTLRAPGEAEPRPSPKTTEADRPKAAPRSPRNAEQPARPRPSSAPIPMGASGPADEVAPDAEKPRRSGFTDRARQAEVLDAARQVGRGAILRLPRGAEFGLKDALLYPIWDAPGVSWMAFLSLPLAFSSVIVFGLIPIVLKGGNNAIMGPFAFPMIIALLFAVGYFTQVLAAVVIDSAANEVHHPKWPEIEFGALVGSLFQWLCGLSVGIGLGSAPALYFWGLREEHGLADHLIASALLATGLLYGLMSLASLLLHGDLLALNPIRVVRGIARAGIPYLKAVALAIVATVLATLAVEGVYRLDGVFACLIATWVAWAWIIYLGVAVSRCLGMVIHSRSEALGWFPKRERWGASTHGIDPSLFEDKGTVKPRRS